MGPSASVSPSSLARGSTVGMTALVTNTSNVVVLVDIEVYDPAVNRSRSWVGAGRSRTRASVKGATFWRSAARRAGLAARRIGAVSVVSRASSRRVCAYLR